MNTSCPLFVSAYRLDLPFRGFRKSSSQYKMNRVEVLSLPCQQQQSRSQIYVLPSYGRLLILDITFLTFLKYVFPVSPKSKLQASKDQPV